MVPVIQLQQIEKNYRIGSQVIPVLKQINLQVSKNEYVALMGPSGSGKSTLMNIPGCLDAPISGIYLLINRDVSSLTDDQLSLIRNREVGFVFQQFNLLPRLTALENVALPLVYGGVAKKQRRARAHAVLEKVNLSNRVHYKPAELSGSQIQRVAVARVRVNDPAMIWADEPKASSIQKLQMRSWNCSKLFIKWATP